MKTVQLLALVVFSVSTIFTPQALSQDRPDVLFIAIDDLNDWVGVMGGNNQIRTPNIDELASRGMLFANAHTPGAACLPTRTAILTGMSPFSSGVYNQLGDWRTNPTFEGKATIPGFFRQNDYLTLGAGKLFHAHTYGIGGFTGQNDPNGWDAYWPSIDRQLPDEVNPAPGQTDGDAVGNGISTGHFDFFPTLTTDDAMGDGQVTSWVIDQIEAAYTGPRFISAGLYRPHLPWYAPQKYFDMYPVENIELPPYLDNDLNDVPQAYQELIGTEPDLGVGTMSWVLERGPTKWREAIQGYMASISFTDAMVGRLLDALDRSGRADNTIIVLWSDHGFHLGEKDTWGKMTLWEETTRVPFIIVAPGVTTPGSVSHEAVSTQSIYATLAELTGLERPGHVDGSSLVPLLREPGRSWDDVAITTYGDYGNFSVRGDRYRYTIYANGDEELYDLQNDPNEWINLADDRNYEEIKESLAARIPPAEEHAPPVGGIDELQQQ
ncbi:MAG: iduronate-2-sulfatase [Gammaproteobacteria bacterium]|nr:iduronate-2-sulfatase [Gammaproteobacteria bacterium]|tara:strand:+ start:354231 stop:355712 length:1482 start_codon:yes stop_codon:yes gene_type:complete